MMPDLVKEYAGAGSVGVATLFEFHFRSVTKRYSDCDRILIAGGREWEASAGVIGVSGLAQSSDMSAGPATFSLSGTTPELLAAAVNSEFEVTDRPCSVYVQFLSRRQTTLDNPIPIWTGLMDVMTFEGEVKNQTISLSAEGLFIRRIRAPHGYMTDPDQQIRYPGDLGMSFMPTLKNKTVQWLRG